VRFGRLIPFLVFPVVFCTGPCGGSVPSNQAAAPASAELPPPRPDATPSVVCYAMDSRAMGPSLTPRQEVVDQIVGVLVRAVTGKSSESEAWRSLVRPGDRVGIKVSALPGPVGGTHPAVVRSVVRGLEEAGIPSRDLLVWDRRREDLTACGFDTVPGLTLRWVENGEGYDPSVTVSAPAIGRLVYGDSAFRKSAADLDALLGPREQLSELSHLPVVLSRDVDKVIVIPSLCDSCFTGVHGALAAMTVGCLDNWRRFGKGGGFGDAALAEVYSDPKVGGKVILAIMDGLMLQYAGGPYPAPGNCVVFSTLFASKDPVAVDAAALRLLDEQRELSRMPKASADGGHVAEAESRGLGNADEKRIRMRRIGEGAPKGSPDHRGN
jgi:uncharacterized protein (DUF362 family)